MESVKKIGYDVDEIIGTFNLIIKEECTILENWLNARYNFTPFEQKIIDDLAIEMNNIGDYFNEEELKIRFIGQLFYLAAIEIPKKVRVFYERPLSAIVENHTLSVICDCLVATPVGYNTPQYPYFFLQEFKKKRGEKNDPEGQMLHAMLIAQQKNNDDKPLYGGYLFGSSWRFTVLDGKNYCQSHNIDATKRADIIHIVNILKHIKELVLNR